MCSILVLLIFQSPFVCQLAFVLLLKLALQISLGSLGRRHLQIPTESQRCFTSSKSPRYRVCPLPTTVPHKFSLCTADLLLTTCWTARAPTPGRALQKADRHGRSQTLPQQREGCSNLLEDDGICFQQPRPACGSCLKKIALSQVCS